MDQPLVVGVDIGTTSAKACVVTPGGEIKSCCRRAYPLLTPRPGWAEQEPDVVVAAVVAAVRAAVQQAQLPPADIGAIGCSAALHSLIAVDAAGRPLTRALTWGDRRSAPQAAALDGRDDRRALYQRTGLPVQAMSPLAKLLWLRSEAPESFARAAKFISIKEYVLRQLAGAYVVDYSTASASGLLNIVTRTWDEEALRLAGIGAAQLSRVVAPTERLPRLAPAYARAMGLPTGVAIVVGAGDGVLATLGAGASAPGQWCVTIGTSSGLRTFAPAPRLDPDGRTFCYAVAEGLWLVGCPSSVGGVALRWLCETFAGDDGRDGDEDAAYAAAIDAAWPLRIGAEGLLFLPFVAGERAPRRHPATHGAFVGLGLHHRRAHLIRAVVEGIFLAVASLCAPLGDLVGPQRELRVTGGFARLPLMRQWMADVFGEELVFPAVAEVACYGAALVALQGMGLRPADDGSPGQGVPVEVYCPDPRRRQRYRELAALFEQAYQSLHETFPALATWVQADGRMDD